MLSRVLKSWYAPHHPDMLGRLCGGRSSSIQLNERCQLVAHRVTSLRCAAGFGRYRGMADIDQATSISSAYEYALCLDRREPRGTVTKPLFNGAIGSLRLDRAQNSRATLVPRGVIMRLFGGRRVPRPMSLLPARGGRAPSAFFLGVAACPQPRSISARADLQIGRQHSGATCRVDQFRLRAR
jgi:hypothetical protein